VRYWVLCLSLYMIWPGHRRWNACVVAGTRVVLWFVTSPGERRRLEAEYGSCRNPKRTRA
jgi:hypothetical protein